MTCGSGRFGSGEVWLRMFDVRMFNINVSWF